MASPTSPTHGKLAAIYRLRPNGFKGNGLNDVTWGTGYSGGGTSGYFEVVIDGTGTPDTFKWRQLGVAKPPPELPPSPDSIRPLKKPGRVAFNTFTILPAPSLNCSARYPENL